MDICPYRFVSFPSKEGVSLCQGEALFIARKRPSPFEEGVSLFCLYRFRLPKHSLVMHHPSLSRLASVRHIPPLERLEEALNEALLPYWNIMCIFVMFVL